MNKNLIPSLVLSSAFLTGCNQPVPENTSTTTPAPASSPAPVATSAPAAETANVAKEDAVAIVNGTAISKANFKTLEDEIALRTHGQKFPKQQLLEELIQRELLVQDAQKKHLDQSAELKQRIEMAERSLLTNANIQDYLKANPVTDAELKAVYEKEVVAKMSGTEYKASHILVKTEAEAKKIIGELSKGAKFADLAKKYSSDPSKDQGGDLGWFSQEQMVEPFSKAVAALEKGKFSQTPVQTQFGWHIILREDSRAQVPPAFDAVKEQLQPMVQQQKVQTMLDDLRKQAKVEILMPLDEPKAEEKPATPAAENSAAPANAEVKATEQPAANTEAKPAAEAATPAEADKAAAATEPAKTDAAATPSADKPANATTEPTKAEAAPASSSTEAKPATPAATDDSKAKEPAKP